MKHYTGKVEVRKKVKTFAVLGGANLQMLIRARQNPCTDSPDVMASLLFSAFTFEAALNHMGAKLIPYWEELERLPWRGKLKIILHYLKLEPDFGKRPYQPLLGLFKFRDAMAHGRDEEGLFIFEVKDVDASTKIPSHPDALAKVSSDRERFCTLANAELAFADSRNIIAAMYKAAKFENEPFGSSIVRSETLVDFAKNYYEHYGLPKKGQT